MIPLPFFLTSLFWTVIKAKNKTDILVTALIIITCCSFFVGSDIPSDHYLDQEELFVQDWSEFTRLFRTFP